MAAAPGLLTAGAGIASQFIAPGNPMGIGMIASGAGSAISGVNQYNQEQAQLSQIPQYYQEPYQMPKSYAHGGIQNTYNPNAEVEKEELMRMPNGATHQVDGPSHAQGGVSVNIPNGTQIFSDRLKDLSTGKTFAKMAEKYKTNKEDKVMKDENASTIAKSTAKLALELKQRKLSEIFNNQETLKADKYQASIDRASKKYGVNPEQFANGGVKLPQYGGEPPYITDGTVNIQQQTNPVWGLSSNDISRTGNPGVDLNNQWNTVNSDFGGGIPMVVDQAKSEDPIYQKANQNRIEMDPNQMDKRSVIGQPTPPSRLKPTLPSAETQGYKPGVGDYISAGAQLGADAIRMAKSLKKPQTYQPSLYRPERYDPSQSLREADQTNRLMREQARVNSGGNAASYIAGMAGLQAGQVGNKNAIRSHYDQMNVNAGNQAGQINSQLLTQRAKDVQQDWSVRDNAIADSANKMASSVANIGKDYNQGAMDQDYLDYLNKSGAYDKAYKYKNSFRKNGR
jgi:hypothetical protein